MIVGLNRAATIVIGVTTILGVGCTPSDEPQEEAELPLLLAECSQPPQEFVDVIAEGLSKVEGGGSLRNAQAVKSESHSNAWFISADIQGPGLEGPNDIATWIKSGDLEEHSGILLSVDAVAKEFSGWPDGSTTDAETSLADGGAQESRTCVEALLR